MRIHTDTLTTIDLNNALRTAELHGVYCEATRRGSRQRDHAFEVRLSAEPAPGRRARNTGRYGAEQDPYTAAATWDEHGAWFAVLFALDPAAIIWPYKGVDDFHEATDDAYRIGVTA